MSKKQDQYDRERLVMRATGLSRRDVRGLDQKVFDEIHTKQTNTGGSKKITGAKIEGGDAKRDEILQQLRDAQPADKGKPFPGVPTALEATLPEKRQHPDIAKNPDVEAEAVDDSAGGAKTLLDITWDATEGVLVKHYSDGTTGTVETAECPAP